MCCTLFAYILFCVGTPACLFGSLRACIFTWHVCGLRDSCSLERFITMEGKQHHISPCPSCGLLGKGEEGKRLQGQPENNGD